MGLRLFATEAENSWALAAEGVIATMECSILRNADVPPFAADAPAAGPAAKAALLAANDVPDSFSQCSPLGSSLDSSAGMWTALSLEHYDQVHKEMTARLSGATTLFLDDLALGSSPDYGLPTRAITDCPSATAFLRESLYCFEGVAEPAVTIYASPGFIPPALLGDPNDQPKDDRLVAAINMERSEVLLMGGGESFGPQHVAALKAAISPVTEVANSQQGVVPFAVASFHDDGPVPVLICGASDAALKPIAASAVISSGVLWDQDGVAQLFRDGGTVGGGDEPLGSPELFLLVPQCDALAAELVPGGVDGLVLSPTQASYMLLGLKHANMIEAAEQLAMLLEEFETTAVLCSSSEAAVRLAKSGGKHGLGAFEPPEEGADEMGPATTGMVEYVREAYPYLPADISELH